MKAADGLLLGDRDAETDGLGETDTLAEADGDGLALFDGEGDGDGLGVEVFVGVGVGGGFGAPAIVNVADAEVGGETFGSLVMLARTRCRPPERWPARGENRKVRLQVFAPRGDPLPRRNPSHVNVAVPLHLPDVL